MSHPDSTARTPVRNPRHGGNHDFIANSIRHTLPYCVCLKQDADGRWFAQVQSREYSVIALIPLARKPRLDYFFACAFPFHPRYGSPGGGDGAHRDGLSIHLYFDGQDWDTPEGRAEYFARLWKLNRLLGAPSMWSGKRLRFDDEAVSR